MARGQSRTRLAKRLVPLHERFRHPHAHLSESHAATPNSVAHLEGAKYLLLRGARPAWNPGRVAGERRRQRNREQQKWSWSPPRSRTADRSYCSTTPPATPDMRPVVLRRYPGVVKHSVLSTTPTAEKPALSDEERAERLRRLAERMFSPDGLDRDTLEHIEQLTGNES